MGILSNIKIKWFLILLVAVLGLALVAYFLVWPRFKPKETGLDLKEVAKVGEEMIYYQDVFAIAKADSFSYFPEDKRQEYSTNRDILLNLYLNKAIEESVLLQEGAKEGFITLSAKVFNTKEKDYEERKRLALLVSGEAASNLVERFSIQAITVYSDNKDRVFLAKDILEEVRAEIEGKTLTMTEAGEKTKNNPEIQSLSNKNQNPYRELSNLDRNYKIFPDTRVNRSIYAGEINQLSDVVLLKPSLRNYQTGRFEEVELGYAIFMITGRTAKENKSYSDWLQSVKGRYKVEIL